MTQGALMRGAMAILLLVVSGCTSTTGSITAAAESTTSPSPDRTVSSTAATSQTDLSGSMSAHQTPNAPTSSSVFSNPECAVAAARAVAAAAALLPEGTSRKPQLAGSCSPGQPLDVTFPAVGKLTWTVSVKVTAGGAADCESGASNAGARCGPVLGHPGFIGAEAVCSAIPCDQAWVSSGINLAVVLGYVPGAQPGMSQRAIPAFNGLGTIIGVSVLNAVQRK